MQEALLTSREIELLALIANGLDNKRIAHIAFYGETPYRKYLQKIAGKKQCSSGYAI